MQDILIEIKYFLERKYKVENISVVFGYQCEIPVQLIFRLDYHSVPVIMEFMVDEIMQTEKEMGRIATMQMFDNSIKKMIEKIKHDYPEL